MKFVSNIFIIIALISYLFCPNFNCGVLNDITGFKFTEETFNGSDRLCMELFVLIPFIGCFLSIFFNYLKNRLWSILSAASLIGVGAFYFFAQDFAATSGLIFNIKSTAWGWTLGVVSIAIALVAAIAATLPLKINEPHRR